MKFPRWILSSVRHLLLLCWPLFIPLSVIADETDIFYEFEKSKVNSNVLFLLDASRSMRVKVAGTTESRMDVLQKTFREVMNNAPANLNIGLMHYANSENFSSYSWSSIKGVNFPVSPIDVDADSIIGSFAATDNLPDPTSGMSVRSFLPEIVDSWKAAGYTPIVDSIYEAARYFRGEKSAWGGHPANYRWAAHPSTYRGAAACAAPTATESCRFEFGECNGSETACVSGSFPQCCDWVGGGDICDALSAGSCTSGYCRNGDFSCSVNVSTCNHETCSGGGDITYKSPIKYACQENYLVVMSDGRPAYPYRAGYTGDRSGQYPKSAYPNYVDTNPFVPNLIPPVGSSQIPEPIPTLIGASCADKPNGLASGTCGPELTEFLATEDQSSSYGGDQVVKTFTVAYDLAGEPQGTDYLKSLSTVTNGHYTANDSTQLVNALTKILNHVDGQSFSFSSPTYSLSKDSVLSSGNDVYVPVFSYSNTPLWSGNLRKLKLSANGHIVGAGGGSVLNNKGQFKSSAQDLWSSAPHGVDAGQGGAASRLPPAAARVRKTDPNGNALVDISSSTAGSVIRKYMLRPDGYTGPIRTPLRNRILDFTRGHALAGNTIDYTTDRQHIGDIINSKPILVNYSATKSLVLVSTNEGYLHAFDADTGVEEWAFMPSSLLKNQLLFMQDNEKYRHVYGLDGELTLWNYDANDDGLMNHSSDKRLLFFGMRRGGNMYYALDVTDPTMPKIEWKISPNSSTAGAVTTGFDQLAETWSKPTLSKMRVASGGGSSSQVKYVLVFGGGYDPKYDEDNPGARPGGRAKGAGVYIVDALTGALLWSTKNDGGLAANDMKHSVAGDIRVLDMDNNGELDRLYFADLGGNVWRADLGVEISSSSASVSLSNKTTLTKLAQLGAVSGGDGDHRKFFYEPDVALRMNGGEAVLTVSLGSGYRTNPMDNGDKDNFYVLLDRDVFRGRDQSPTAVIKHGALKVARSDGSGLGGGGSILDHPGKDGWYMPLPHHSEKVLASSVTFLDKVLFTTFAMADENGVPSSIAACDPLDTSARAYVLDIMTAKAVADLERDGAGTNEPFVVAGGVGEILDTPQLIFGKPTDGSGGACTEGNCQQDVSVRVGKLKVPLLDSNNTSNGASSSFGEMVDVTRLLPRLFWRDEEVTVDP